MDERFRLRKKFREWRRINWFNPHRMRLKWERVADGFTQRVEPGNIRIGHLMYLFCGYRTLDDVASTVEILDLNTGQWSKGFDTPEYISQTHQGLAVEGDRYVYHVAGQVGIQCSPAVDKVYCLDLKKQVWLMLPSLPEIRYSPVTCLWNGRLHVLSGSGEDRVTPMREHWSLAVKDGKALEDHWRKEPAIPLGGPHRASGLVKDTLYVLGGQEGDRPRIKGDPRHTCDWTYPKEIIYPDSFALDSGAKEWRPIAPMPLAATHTEFGSVIDGSHIIILGGLINGLSMTNLIQAYDTVNDQWKILGTLPWYNKGCFAALHDGWLYVGMGQKEKSATVRTFGDVLKECYRCRFDLRSST